MDKYCHSYETILQKIDEINPINYARTRNFVDGNVSHLSPYISRGIISTQFVLQRILANGYTFKQSEKFIQELAWRDFWQNKWNHQVDINIEKYPQGKHIGLPETIKIQQTGIKAIDEAITDLIQTGYMHNHVRMYVAMLITNIGQYNWLTPAKWMYYHLLDGDWASNALSWQWVAGVSRQKKYYANQENINKYTYSKQINTYLEVDYPSLTNMAVPKELMKSIDWNPTTVLPFAENLTFDNKPTLIYNYYNLDPNWRKSEDYNRVFLIEPSLFSKYPISDKCMQFALYWAKQIPNLQVAVMEFNELQKLLPAQKIYAKQHPLNNYQGVFFDERAFMISTKRDYRSFFQYWKAIQKELIVNYEIEIE